MKPLIFFASFILSFSVTLLAQAPDTIWTKTIGGAMVIGVIQFSRPPITVMSLPDIQILEPVFIMMPG